jgi:arginase family enzyme
MQNYFINIPFDNSNAKNTIYNNFDYEIKDSLYSTNDNNDIPIVYNFLYKYLKSLDVKKRPVVFSPDYSISSATCTAIAERYMEKIDEKGNTKFISPMKVIYFTSTSHLKKMENISALDFSHSILTNILNDCEVSYTNHNFIINPSNFILVGINDKFLSQDDVEKLKLNEIKYFTLNTIKKKGISNISEFIIDEIGGDPVYIIYDMSVLSFDNAPSIYRICGKSDDINKLGGLSNNNVIDFFSQFKKLNIVGLDITGFNLREKTPDVLFKLTTEAGKLALVNLLQIKEKKINIFNENTKIIICKPLDKKEKNNWAISKDKTFESEEKKQNLFKRMKEKLEGEELYIDSDSEEKQNEEQEEEEDNIGWYVMRGITTDMKEQIITKINESEDNIILYSTDDESMYISYTTLEEQEKKSFYDEITLKDRVLYPGEKVNLIFSQI